MLDHNSPLPLYYQLYEILKRQIETGEIAYGEKLPSESEMMQDYGIGRLTVRGALSQLVNMGYLEKMHGKGTFCRYTPAPKPRRSIDVLLDIEDSYFIPYYMKSISQVLADNECDIRIGDTKNSSEEICLHLERILRIGSSGVILQPDHKSGEIPERMIELFDRLAAAQIPYIFIDSTYGLEGASYVSLNETMGGRMVAEYFLALGHKRAATLYVDGFKDSLQRRDGFLRVYFERDLPEPACFPYHEGVLAEIARGVREKRFTAIFCYNDSYAIDLMQYMKSQGISVPGDLSVIGFDDAVIATTVEPALSSIAHPKQKIGEETAMVLLDFIEKRRRPPYVHLHDPCLIPRASCVANFSG